MTNKDSKYSNCLKAWRTEANLTQQELADELGVSRQSLNALETGRCLPSFKLSILIEDFFNQPIRKIFNKGEKMFEDFKFEDLKQEVDRAVSDGFSSAFGTFPAINVFEKAGRITLEAELPGMNEKDLEIDVTKDAIRIAGEKKETREIKENNYFKRESSFGQFDRTISLPVAVDHSKAKAKLKNGKLFITIPVLKGVNQKVKRLKIKGE